MAVKKSASKKPTAQRESIPVSKNVKVVPGKMSPWSTRFSSVNEKQTSGADQARAQNAAKTKTTTAKAKATETKANARALKAANKPLSKGNAKAPFKGGDSKNVLANAKPANPNVVRGGSMKSKINWPKAKGGGIAGGLNINNLKK